MGYLAGVVRVTLYDFVGTGLIIKAKTGIVWTNQAGGTACLQPECEGLFVPFGNDTRLDGKLISLENSLFELFQGAAGGLTFAEGWAEAFEEALSRYAAEHWRAFSAVTLDRALVHESVEAWVHVIYHPTSDFSPLFEGLGEPPFGAVLTWTNSD